MRAILERDFLQFAKRPRYFVSRSFAVGLPLVLLGLFASVGNLRSDEMGQMVFHTTVWPILFLAALYSPSMVAPILVEERQNNRLEVLRSTPMSAAHIVLGRWLSRVALIWSMLIAALPLAAASLLFGGVDPNDFYLASAVILITVPFVSSIALCISAGGGDSGVVLRITYSVVLVLLLLPAFMMGPAQFIRGTPGGMSGLETALMHLMLLDPLVALMASLDGARGGQAFVMHPLAVFTVMSLIITAALVAWSIHRITQPANRRKKAAQEEPSVAAAMSRAGGDPSPARSKTPPITREKGRFSAGLRQLWRNPPLWLELRRSSSRAGRFRRVAFWVAIPVLEICFLVGLVDQQGLGRSGSEFHILPLILCFLFCVFAIATTGATAVHRDGEANTLEVLHASPLQNGLLAAAKVGAALRAAMMWFLFGVGHLIVGVAFGDIKIVTAVASLILVCGMLFSLAGFAVRYGMTATTLNRASARVMGTVVSHLVISPVIGGIFVAMFSFEAAGLLLGHHPIWIVGIPLAVQEGGSNVLDFSPFWFGLIYFACYVGVGLHMVFHSIPASYASLRDDTKVVGYERG